jgi:hypothetical protein
VALNKISCPKCGAGLKSQTGFQVGLAVRCPKCRKEFDVEAPEAEEDEDDAPARGPARKPVRAVVEDDEDADDRPRKKKRRRDDDDEDDEDKKSNTAFYIRLGVLLVIMIVLGVALLVLGPGGFNKQ